MAKLKAGKGGDASRSQAGKLRNQDLSPPQASPSVLQVGRASGREIIIYYKEQRKTMVRGKKPGKQNK